MEPSRDDDEDMRSWQRDDVDDPQEEPVFRLLRRPWASINGEDVCPRCQTMAERKDVARRIISAVEGEINRSVVLDVGPSPVEPGLVTFAMQLREALLDVEPSHSSRPAQDASEEAGPQRDRTKLDVAITGAFLTGCPLDVSLSEYQDVQRRLATKLTEYPGQGWLTGHDEAQEGTYNTGGGFSSMLPLVVAYRGGNDALARTKEILNARPASEHDWLDQRMSGWKMMPTSMRIDVYDLGVAVINGGFSVDVPASLSLAAAAGVLEQMVWLRSDGEGRAISPITGTFRELSKETTRQFREGIGATPEVRMHAPWLPVPDPDQEQSGDWGRLLWLHPVHMLTSRDQKARISKARALAPTFSKIISVPDGRFVTGIGRSAIVTDHDPARDLPMKLVLLHWAYFAHYMEIDRGLMAVLDEDESGTTPVIRELEEAADGVFDKYIRVMKARARVDTALASLGGDEQAIWDAIAAVQKFDDLTGGVDRKVEVLQRIADRRVQQASSESARRTAKILGFLTTLTVVTLAIGLLGYFFGGLADRDDAVRPLRFVFLAGGLVSAVILWYWIFSEHRWRRKKQKAHRAAERRPVLIDGRTRQPHS